MDARARATAFLDGVIDRVAWERLLPGGRQLPRTCRACAGLALLRRLRARYPEVRTAMGGANCEGQMGAAIHALFPFVDYVCSGEGDSRRPRAGAAPAGRRVPARICRGSSPAACRAPSGREDPRPDGASTWTACRTRTSTDYFTQFLASRLAAHGDAHHAARDVARLLVG